MSIEIYYHDNFVFGHIFMFLTSIFAHFCILCTYPVGKQQEAYKEGPYQDRPPLCPFRLLPLLIYSGSTIAFLKILKVQGPKSKNIENVILLQP